jgi:hypothetical protein
MCRDNSEISAACAAESGEELPSGQAGANAVIARLEKRYERLMARSGKLVNYVQQRQRRNISDTSIQAEHDAISEEMLELSRKLSQISISSMSALKLKASLLLDLMPDEDDAMVFLALSLCDDILRMPKDECGKQPCVALAR